MPSLCTKSRSSNRRDSTDGPINANLAVWILLSARRHGSIRWEHPSETSITCFAFARFLKYDGGSGAIVIRFASYDWLLPISSFPAMNASAVDSSTTKSTLVVWIFIPGLTALKDVYSVWMQKCNHAEVLEGTFHKVQCPAWTCQTG